VILKDLTLVFFGMTVNERLYVSGLMDEFDRAVEERDIERVRSILTNVELTEESIRPILEKLGLLP
jgi:molecular chaperone GrpE (heat shock protein)